MGLSSGPNQAQKGNYEVCLKKYSFPPAGGRKGGWVQGEAKKGNTAFVLAKQHNLKPFLKDIPKYHSIKLYIAGLLQFLHIMNKQKTEKSFLQLLLLLLLIAKGHSD